MNDKRPVESGNVLDEFTAMVLRNEAFIFAKFGDGELGCMNGNTGENCDGHPYTPALAVKLRNALHVISGLDNAYIAEWDGEVWGNIRNKYTHPNHLNDIKLVDYQVLLSVTEHLDSHLQDFYRAIKKASTSKGVVFIIPKELNPVVTYIASSPIIINIPKVNAFSVYDDALGMINSKMKDGDILITACGLMAKPLIADAVVSNPNITCLDFGSAFDPLVLGNTRLGQAPVKDVKTFFNAI